MLCIIITVFVFPQTPEEEAASVSESGKWLRTYQKDEKREMKGPPLPIFASFVSEERKRKGGRHTRAG